MVHILSVDKVLFNPPCVDPGDRKERGTSGVRGLALTSILLHFPQLRFHFTMLQRQVSGAWKGGAGENHVGSNGFEQQPLPFHAQGFKAIGSM